MPGCRVIESRVFKDLSRPRVFHRDALGWTNDAAARRTTHGGQFDLCSMRRRDKTQVYIDRLAWFIRRATDGAKPPFFAIA